jgi:hypothetical protein|tara:strand:+ start:142 stop:261 length:120 start_codon:yes stop_codon:yes gene_type:complete
MVVRLEMAREKIHAVVCIPQPTELVILELVRNMNTFRGN